MSEREALIESPKQQAPLVPPLTHYLHPTDPAKYWCGATRTPGPIGKAGPQNIQMAECVVCHDIWVERGTLGWMREAGQCGA